MDFCKLVHEKVQDAEYVDAHKNKGAPLAMLAFAEEVAKSNAKHSQVQHTDGGDRAAAIVVLLVRLW